MNFNTLNYSTISSLLFFLFFQFSVSGQNFEGTFPDDFFGIYTGTLAISLERGNQEVMMEFHLLPTEIEGKYTYTLVYGEGESKQVREYHLLEKNKEKGTYVVDENNGIVLDDKVIGNRMYALFEVNETLLTTFITFETDHLVFEIVATPKAKKRVTHADDEAKTEVISYPITTVQRAVLQKQ